MIILSIGRNAQVLQEVTEQLNTHGFNATWTNYPDTVSTLFNGSDLDMIAFCGGVNEKTRLFIKKILSVQNPSIIFVDCLAPISSLLVDQIRHSAALAKGRNGNPVKEIEIKKDTYSVGLTAVKECQIKIDIYQFGFFYGISEKVVAKTHLAPGKHSFSIDKKDKAMFGNNFIVVKADDKPLHIETL